MGISGKSGGGFWGEGSLDPGVSGDPAMRAEVSAAIATVGAPTVSGAVIDDPDPLGWDLAFRRHDIIVNGGDGFAGRGGAVALEGVAFDSLAEAPAGGYRATEAGRDSVQLAFRRWYDYGFTSHLLEPKDRIYAVRTADGRYAKMEIVSYYCPEAVSGCLTFRYVYQGSGSRELTP